MAKEMRELFHSMSAEERIKMHETQPEMVRTLRRATYTEHLGEMAVPGALKKWDVLMKHAYPGGVEVWKIPVSWLEALMVVRYGEDTRSWPDGFSDEDVLRAQRWLEGKHPSGVSYPHSTIEKASLVALLGLGLAGFLASAINWDPAVLFLLPLLGSAMTDFLENKLVDNFFRTTTYSRPTVLGVALFTAAPGETGGGTEVSGGSYARVDLPPLNTNWNATQGGTSGNSSGTGGLTDNAVTITFPTPSANWGVVTHMAIFDATSAGNMLIYGSLAQSKTINNGDPAPTFPAGALDVTFA
jgi:hypothetical protein